MKTTEKTKKYLNPIITSIIFGVLAVLMGTLNITNTFMYSMEEKTGSFYLFSKTGIIMSEIFIEFAFLVLIVMLIQLVDKVSNFNNLLLVVAITKLLVLIVFFISCWKPGWYYILDPAGNYSSMVFALIFSVLQAVLLLVPAFKKTGIDRNSIETIK
jgi:hypothetical protein